MSEITTKSVLEMLNEEKWTRATLNNYTVHNFEKIDGLLEIIVAEGIQDEVKTLCDEHIVHTKNSIIGLYISGILSLSRQLVDDSNLISLITIFMDNHKWPIVEYLCYRILQFTESKFALRTLADCYQNQANDEKKYEIWERLIKVDYEEADIVKILAEKKESAGEIDAALIYYKKAIYRFINKKAFTSVKEIWTKLVERIPQEKEFFLNLEKKVARTLSADRSVQLLTDLFPYYRDKLEWETGIEILKRVLAYDPHNTEARREIVECYRGKYAEHSQLEECIKVSNLTQSWRNIHDAITDFEKHIAFDTGNFVYHRTWGVGRIAKIDGDNMTIDFVRKREHSMSLRMAVGALKELSKDHIWVYKTTWKKDELRTKCKTDVPWALRTVIRSWDNDADMKRIKSELVPGVLTESDWSSFSTEARKILKTDPMFGNHPDKADSFTVRETPVSYEEKAFNRFKAEKDFYARVAILMDFLDHSEPDSEYFGEMYAFFNGFLKSYTQVNDMVITSFLLIQKIGSQYTFLNPGSNEDFYQLFSQAENPEIIFKSIEDSDLKRDFLIHLKTHLPQWPDWFVRIFPYYLNRFVIDELKLNKEFEKLEAMVRNYIEQYKEHREPFVWVVRNLMDEPWFQKLGIPFEKILIGLIRILDISFREINNKREINQNRRINKQISTYLFKEETLSRYIADSTEEQIQRIFSLIEDVKELDPSLRIELKHKVMERFPEFRFLGESETKEKATTRILVTQTGYERKQKELQHIMEVEVPENSKEISVALALGDLRENAEYKAAKEKQELLNSTVAKLKEDISRSQIVMPKDVENIKIAFGTTILLVNLETGKEETYSIFGPWESDPDKNVISYLSPFGSGVCGHRLGDEMKFTINEREYSYRVKDLQVAEFK